MLKSRAKKNRDPTHPPTILIRTPDMNHSMNVRTTRPIRRWLTALVCALGALGGSIVATTTTAPAASAAPCSDVAVVFARGTAEPAPMLGLTGISFVESMRSQLRGKSVAAEGVNYAASDKFNNRVVFVCSVADGVRQTQRDVTAIARSCPKTRIVLGGYSQGAVVAGYATSGKIAIPDRYRQYEREVPPPLPADVASHIAAIVMFGAPSDRFITDIGAPPVRVGSAYRGRTVRYCIPGDTICNGAPVGGPNATHVLYTVNGMTMDAARFAVRRL